MNPLILFLVIAAVILPFRLMVFFSRDKRRRRGPHPGDVGSGSAGFFDVGDSGGSGSHGHHHSSSHHSGGHHGGFGGGHHGGFDGGGHSGGFGGGHH